MVLIADGVPLVRAALRHHLRAEPDIDVVGETAAGDQAVTAARRLHPHVVLMDLSMSRMDGVTAIRELAHPPAGRGPGIIALAGMDTGEHLFEALRAGAVGYLLKNSDPGVYTQAIRHVRHGHGFIDPQVTHRLIQRFTELSPYPPPPALRLLTPREREVLHHLAQGLANRAIARTLNISEGTVKLHVNHILGKLRLGSRVQATIYAYRYGIATPGTLGLL